MEDGKELLGGTVGFCRKQQDEFRLHRADLAYALSQRYFCPMFVLGSR